MVEIPILSFYVPFLVAPSPSILNINIMLQTILGIIATIGIGAFAWAATIHQKVGILEARDEDLRDFLDTRFDAVNNGVEDVKNRLTRIEDRMRKPYV